MTGTHDVPGFPGFATRMDKSRVPEFVDFAMKEADKQSETDDPKSKAEPTEDETPQRNPDSSRQKNFGKSKNLAKKPPAEREQESKSDEHLDDSETTGSFPIMFWILSVKMVSTATIRPHLSGTILSALKR